MPIARLDRASCVSFASRLEEARVLNAPEAITSVIGSAIEQMIFVPHDTNWYPPLFPGAKITVMNSYREAKLFG